MMKRLLAGMLIFMLLIGSHSAEGIEDKTSDSDQQNTAAYKLKAAWALKRTSFKKEPEVKKEILLKTVVLYQAMLSEYPDASSECAEACYRIGEIYRSLKLVGKAEAAFNMVLTYEKNSDFAARALNELGHIYRRYKEYDKAINYYQKVQTDCPAQKDRCADAYTWIGKVYLLQKQYDKARSIFLSFPDKFPGFYEDAVRNIDLAVNSLITEGNLEDAAALLSKWRQHFESLLGKDKKLDKKIERALDRMKSPDKLKK